MVQGAPLIGGRTVYFKACDATGCGNEQTVSIPAVTPVPVPTFGDPLRNVISSRFALINITQNIPAAYGLTGSPVVLLWGIMYLCVFVGFWLRTRSVGLALFMVLLTVPFLVSEYAGLYLGMPSIAVGFIALLAAAMAGLLMTLVKSN